jgi:hypothetical protein
LDTAEFGVRARVSEAAIRGGFVLLIGGSSVGKSRCAYEAIRAVVPDWFLFQPDRDQPAELAALLRAAPERTVVWLDELQRYLGADYGLSAALIRAALDSAGPVLLIGTLWPELYRTYTAQPQFGRPDPWATQRDLLAIATTVRIGAELSRGETTRARQAAQGDRRIEVALRADGYGLTQTLAAAPELVARWEDARTAAPYAWAVMTAALDAARLGARAPLGTELLREAAPGYCSPPERAAAPADWFEKALAYATEELHGAAAVLVPDAPEELGMGRLAGYATADYLRQHAATARCAAAVPASTWHALVRHHNDPQDAARLAASAHARLLYDEAELFYRRAITGDTDTFGVLAEELVGLLLERGDHTGAEEFLLQAQSHHPDAAHWRAALRADAGDEAGALAILRGRARDGDRWAAHHLADQLLARGDNATALQVLRARADAGDQDADQRLAALLSGRADHDGLAEITDRAGRGSTPAAHAHASALAAAGHPREATAALRVLIGHGDGLAAVELARMQVNAGQLDAAEQTLHTPAAAGDPQAAAGLALLRNSQGRRTSRAGHRPWNRDQVLVPRLIALLLRQGQTAQAERVLRVRAAAGDRWSADRLAEILADQHRTTDLTGLADTGNPHAATLLAQLLHADGDRERLRQRADAQDPAAGQWLCALLYEQADRQALDRRARTGDQAAATWLIELLYQQDDLDALQQCPHDAGTLRHQRIIDLHHRRGDLNALAAHARAGDIRAAQRLTELQARAGDLDSLRARAESGDPDAAQWLVETLYHRRDLTGLRAEATLGTPGAAPRLVALLTEPQPDADGTRPQRPAHVRLARG